MITGAPHVCLGMPSKGIPTPEDHLPGYIQQWLNPSWLVLIILYCQETKEHVLLSFQLHHNWPRPLPMCPVSRATLMEEWRRWPEGRKQRTLSVDRFTRLQLPTEPFLIAVGRYKSHGQEWELYLQTEPRIFQWSNGACVSMFRWSLAGLLSFGGQYFGAPPSEFLLPKWPATP